MGHLRFRVSGLLRYQASRYWGHGALSSRLKCRRLRQQSSSSALMLAEGRASPSLKGLLCPLRPGPQAHRLGFKSRSPRLCKFRVSAHTRAMNGLLWRTASTSSAGCCAEIGCCRSHFFPDVAADSIGITRYSGLR